MITRPVIRYHGGKFRLADWILPLIPDHQIYVEPYGGAASVLLRKPRSYAEVYNDLDDDVVGLFRVLRDPEQADQLIQQMRLTPYARSEFEMAWEQTSDPIERARRLCIRAQMGFGSAGATKQHTGFRTYTRERSGSTVQSDWTRYPDTLRAVTERLQSVLIECRPALQVMRDHDSPSTVHFVDPPYVPATRAISRGAKQLRAYRHEMSDADHAELLEVLRSLEGFVLLCGYDNAMYRRALKSWTRIDKARAASGQRGSAARVESIWLSPRTVNAQGQLRLLA